MAARVEGDLVLVEPDSLEPDTRYTVRFEIAEGEENEHLESRDDVTFTTSSATDDTAPEVEPYDPEVTVVYNAGESCGFTTVRDESWFLRIELPHASDDVAVAGYRLFEVTDLDGRHLRSTLLEGDEARAVCRVACDGCGKCAQDAAPGLIHMENTLPVVGYSAGGPAAPEATRRCPTGAIRWVEGEQLLGIRETSVG